MVANGICNEADLKASSNLRSLLSDSMVLKVSLKSGIKAWRKLLGGAVVREGDLELFKELKSSSIETLSVTCL